MKLGHVERQILTDFAGEVRSLAELAQGHPYISAQTSLKSLEAKGLVETWYVMNEKRGGAVRKLARLTPAGYDLMWSGVPL